MTVPSVVLGVRWAHAASAHAYFDRLRARPDCLVAYALRTPEEIAALQTLKDGVSEKGEWRYPVVYDAAMDAARWKIFPQSDPETGLVGSTDGEHKRLPMMVGAGSILVTWDCRFDEGNRWRGPGYTGKHKIFNLGRRGASGDDRYLQLKSDYKNATQVGQGVAEMFASMGSSLWGPGHGGEVLPALARFFVEVDRWTRIWLFFAQLEGPEARFSFWMADAVQGVRHLIDQFPVNAPGLGRTFDSPINKLWLEYDTSDEDVPVNAEMRPMLSWNRNVVALAGLTIADVEALLDAPAD